MCLYQLCNLGVFLLVVIVLFVIFCDMTNNRFKSLLHKQTMFVVSFTPCVCSHCECNTRIHRTQRFIPG